MIYGRPAIWYTLEKLDYPLHFVLAPHLTDFKEIFINLFPKKALTFTILPYYTRGAAESAYLGTSELDGDDGDDVDNNIVFLDNDILYTFPEGWFTDRDTAFLGYGVDDSGTDAYSFLQLSGDSMVTQYKEKVRISNTYCCGIYGFKNISQFRQYCDKILSAPLDGGELYMSSIYIRMLLERVPVAGVHLEKCTHIGTLTELQATPHDWRQMRVCFDLDNTLVTYPSTPGDYSTVRPIHKMIQLVRELKDAGHTIIIYTARRMATHNGNVGAVVRDIGKVTMDTLERFRIPYDELIFGKPIADMYIDDRAINPYSGDLRSMGLIHYQYNEQPPNMLSCNSHNRITLKDGRVQKVGPAEFMRGEIYYYSKLHDTIKCYFPKFYGYVERGPRTEIYLECLKCVPFYTLYHQGLVTTRHLEELYNFLDVLHNIQAGSKPELDDVIANYGDKLVRRFAVKGDYPFSDADEVQRTCLQRLESYVPHQIVHYIHGDLWFSNILVHQGLRYIDMKGQLNGKLTTGGDPLYDYGKLYQSFLGYDDVLYGKQTDGAYAAVMLEHFLRHLGTKGIDIEELKTITFSLVMGTFHATPEERRPAVWSWIKSTFMADALSQ